MENVRNGAESGLLDVARRSRRARARMLRAKTEIADDAPSTDHQLIDLTDHGPRVRLFGRSNVFPRSDRPSTE